MKKVLFLSFIFFLLLALAGFSPVKADDVVVNDSYIDTPNLSQSDIDTYNSTIFLMEYLRNGGTIDFANTSSDYSLSDFFSQFDDFVYDVLGKVVQVVNPFQEEFQWGNGYPLKPATPSIIDFMGRLPFYALQSEDHDNTPQPNLDYSAYLEYINGTGFFFKNWTQSTLYPQYTNISMALYPPAQYSWCVFSETTNISNSALQSNNNTSYWYSSTCNITSVYIISQDDKYYFTYSGNCPINYNYFGNQYNSALYRVVGGSQYIQSGSSAVGNYTYTSSLFNSLNDLFLDLIHRVKNVNIYVNDVLWSLANSTTTSYNIEISTGTVTPQGERVRWMYDKEIYVDIDKLLERLEDILYAIKNTPNTPTIIKFTDFDDLIVDVDGQPALAVKVVYPDTNIDEEYISLYGPLIPVFLPLATPVINDSDIFLIASTPMSAIPTDLLEVFGYIFIGMLFVCFIHRLLE